MKEIKSGDLLKLREQEVTVNNYLNFKLTEPVEVVHPFLLKDYSQPDDFITKKKFKIGFDCYFNSTCYFL